LQGAIGDAMSRLSAFARRCVHVATSAVRAHGFACLATSLRVPSGLT
jgi:hypothetical protein